MDGKESKTGDVLGNDQMKRYIVISRMTSRGTEYRIYDQILECALDGGFETQRWAESIAELMEDKWRNEKHKRNAGSERDVTEGTR